MIANFDRIRDRRLELGLSQKQLSDQSNISIPTIIALENGQQSNPKLSTLTRIAHVLDIPGTDLILETPLS